MEKAQLKQEIIETFKKLSSLEKQFKELYEDEDLDLGWGDRYVASASYTHVTNEFPDITRQNEQWVGLQIETNTGLKFHFDFSDLDDVDDLISSLHELRDFVEDKNENWTIDDLNED